MRVILYHFKQIEELESVLDRRQARCVKRQQSLQDMEEVVYASSSVVTFQIVIICSYRLNSQYHQNNHHLYNYYMKTHHI